MLKKRIGIDCRMYSSSFTGIGRYVYELVSHLASLDTQNDYFLFFNPVQYYQFQKSAPNFFPVLTTASYYSLSEQTLFLQQLNAFQLDLMHFTHFNAPLLYNRPSIVTIHDLTLHFFPGKKMTSWLYRLGYHQVMRNITVKAKRIISVSANTKQDLEKIMSVPASKINVIYNGLGHEFKAVEDQKVIKQVQKKFSITKPFFLYSGVWRDHKNVKGLIEAFRLFSQQNSDTHQLVITGKLDSPYAPEIFEAAASLRASNQIVFPGHVSEPELITLLTAAAAYVFPSFYEGFGLPPLEAMACGTPVIVSNTSSLPEVCGKAALFFDPYDPVDIAAKMTEITSDDALRQRLINLGKKHIRDFSWSKMTDATYQLYQEILS